MLGPMVTNKGNQAPAPKSLESNGPILQQPTKLKPMALSHMSEAIGVF